MVPIGFGTQIFPKGIYLLSPRANYKYTKTLETLYLNFMKQVRPHTYHVGGQKCEHCQNTRAVFT